MRLLESPAAKCVAAYATASLGTQLLAKVVVTKFFFDYPIVILMLQHAAALLIIEVLRVVSFVKLAPYSFDRGRHLFLPSTLLAVSSWLSVASLEGIGMPAFDAVKRFTPTFVLLGVGVVARKQRIDQKQTVAVLVLCVAASLCVNFDLSIDRFSVFYGLISAILQAVAFMQLESLSSSFQPIELLYMHSFNSLVVFLLADIVQDEIRDAFMYMMTSANSLFTTVLFILLLAGFVLQYATLTCLSSTGALNTAVVGNVRSAIQIMVAYHSGAYLFYDVSPLFVNWIGLFAAFGAGYVLYKEYSAPTAIAEKNYGPLA